MRAALRWIRADLRSHWFASLLVILAVVGTVTALLLAGTLLDAAFDPWQRAFRAADAPQLRIDTVAADDTQPQDAPGSRLPLSLLSSLPGVTRLTVQQPTADVTLLGLAPAGSGSGPQAADHLPFSLRADEPHSPRPLMEQGSWLTGGGADQVVLERSAAEAAWAHVGDLVTVAAAGKRTVSLRVVGVADSPDQVSYSGAGYGLAWVTPGVLDQVQPDQSAQGRTVGLYLADAGNAGYLVQRAVTLIGSQSVARLSTWKDARDSQEQDSRLAGLLLGLSGLGALLAAALAVAGAAGGRIRGRLGDIALLKALGFTRAQVVGMFLAQHLFLAGGGALLGATLAGLLAPAFGDPGTPDPLGPAVVGAVTVAALLVIGGAAALPAWRAGRVPGVPVAEGDTGSPEAPVRLAWSLRRLPVAVILGLSSAVRRPRAGAVTVLRVALPVVACTLALSTWATLNAIDHGGVGTMTRATVTVRTDPAAPPDPGLPARLARLGQVQGVYPGDQLQALVPGQSATVTLRALGTATHAFPYTVVQGRGIRATDEAVAGQAALDLLDAKVGQWVRLTTQGTPRILHIVGRSLDPDLGGRVISTGWDTLDRPGDPARPAFYSLVLRPGADVAATRQALETADGTGTGLDVRPAPDSLSGAGGLRGSALGLVALLAVIVASELLSVAGTGLREHRRDLGVLRALGLTPRQVTSMMMVRGAALALAGVAIGVLLGLPLAGLLINVEGRDEGVGAGIAQLPDLRLLLVLALAVSAGACLCALPALRAARSPLPPRH